MQFVDARVRLQHPCPFCDFSKAFPDMEMSSYCNIENEVMQIVALDEKELGKIIDYAENVFGTRHVVRDKKSLLCTTKTCLCNEFNSISSITDKHNCWSVPPTLYFGGWETHRIIAHCRTELRKFVNDVKKIGKIEILSVREREQLDMLNSFGVAPVRFFDGLTDKQLKVVVSAYENGLLEIPAKTRMDRVAKMEGLSRSTYGEHLRKAMLQLVQNSYPILKLYSEGSPGQEL